MFVGGWWAVKKLDKTPEATMKRPSHDLGDQAERSGTWREWLEQKESPPKEG